MIHELLPWMLAIGKYILASAVLLVFYRVFLRKKTSYAESRLFLLSVALLAIAVSQFRIQVTHPAPIIVEVEQQMSVAQQEPLLTVADGLSFPLQAETAVMTEKTGSTVTSGVAGVTKVAEVAVKPKPSSIQQAVIWIQSHALNLLLSVYVLVVLILVINLLLQFRSIRKLRRTGMGSLHDGYTLVEHTEVSTPFSFATTIFLPTNLNASQRDIVVSHERWHIRHKHYVDVVMQEIMCCFFWFNPVQWMLRKDLRSVHELQADRSVLNEGCDVYHYQTVILEEVLGHHFRLSNGFNQSFTKKRFVQMKQVEPFRLTAVRKVASVSFIVLLFVALSVVPGKSQVIRVERSSTTSRTDNGSNKTVTTRSVDTLSNTRLPHSTNIEPTLGPGQLRQKFALLLDTQQLLINRFMPITHRLARSPHPTEDVSDMNALLEVLNIKLNDQGVDYNAFSPEFRKSLTKQDYQAFEKTLINMNDSIRLYRTYKIDSIKPFIQKVSTLIKILDTDNLYHKLTTESIDHLFKPFGYAVDGMTFSMATRKGRLQRSSENRANNDEENNTQTEDVVNQTNQSVLANVAYNDKDKNIRLEAVRKLTNQSVLVNVAYNDNELIVRREAVLKLTNESVLANVAYNDINKNIRLEAVRKLTNQSVLANVAYNDNESIVRRVAVSKLTNESVLANVLQNDDDKNVRIEALNRMDQLDKKSTPRQPK